MNENNKIDGYLAQGSTNNNKSVVLSSNNDKSVSSIDNITGEIKLTTTKNKQTKGLAPGTKTTQMGIFDKSRAQNDNRISKGDLLEYRLKRLIFAMGYFPKIGVMLKTSQDDEQSDMITDLDVYGFYIHKNFASKTIWADCKSGKAKPLERVLWIIGVKNIARIDDVIFVKKGIRSSTRKFARKSSIQILDLEIIEKLEHDFNIEISDWRGSWNPSTQMNQLVRFQKINIPSSDTYKKIGNFISSSYWTFDNFTQVKKVITALKQLAEIEQYPLQREQNESVRWAIFELINLFLLATLNISKELYYFSDKDKKETILDRLISGQVSSKKRMEIVEASYKIALSIIQKKIPNFNTELQIPKIGLNPPEYFEAFNDLVLRITNNPLNYFDILRFLDFTFMEFDLPLNKINKDTLKIMFPNYDNLFISAKTIIHFVCSITGMSRNLFQIMN